MYIIVRGTISKFKINNYFTKNAVFDIYLFKWVGGSVLETHKKSVYIETTIPSVIVARPSKNIVSASKQLITVFFWDKERRKYDLYISDYVMEECKKGDLEAAKKRQDLIKDIPYLEINTSVEALAMEYFRYLKIPMAAKTDCFHLAVCVVNKVDYLLSWNLRHLGARNTVPLYEYNIKHGLYTPELLDPEFFLRTTGSWNNFYEEVNHDSGKNDFC